MKTSRIVETKSTNTESSDKENKSHKLAVHVILSLCTVVISIAFAANLNQKYEKLECQSIVKEIPEKRPVYWVFSQTSNVESKSGIMKHIHLVLDRVGFSHGTNSSDWDLLWSHDYPFRLLYNQMRSLKPNQLVNHFPGTGFITNKVDFATSASKYIPKAFKIPGDAQKLQEYGASDPNLLFVLKDNQHRRVKIKGISEINVTEEGNFVQEYVQKPFLVDGHKFDIGVYTIITSVNPLRVYVYKGDVLFRYCPSKYYPFDPEDLDKYVIGDDYLPTWEVPSLAPLYTAMGYGMKDSFEAYVRSQGKDPSIIWEQVDDFIAEIFQEKEHLIIAGVNNYPSGANFFELMRFDFVIDEELRLYALEANMSPNLSSAHYPPNQLLYEQVLYSIMSLVGVARYVNAPSLRERNTAEAAMLVSDKNLAVWGEACGADDCRESCEGRCALCRPCLSPATKRALSRAYKEHVNKNDCKRVYPPAMVQGGVIKESILSSLSPANQLMHLWFQGKCNVDVTFCT